MMLAYLDPGSGSALLGTIVAMFGAMAYSLKGVLYRILRKETHEEVCHTDIAILSEGKNYWGTFKPIVDELLNREINFSYYSMDLDDPALEIDNPHMYRRLFDKEKISSFANISKIKAKLLISTTPNIGNDNYPVKRPEGVGMMAHVFHAFDGCARYHKGSLDAYDVAILVGPHQEKQLRTIEKARNLKEKTLVALGLPYIDDLAERLKNLPAQTDKPIVLVASSWGAKGCLVEYGIDFVLDLAKAGFEVIVRPHPQSYISEPGFMKACVEKTKPFANITWDNSTSPDVAMAKASLLISDTSSIRFDYAFLLKRPVISLEIPAESQTQYEADYLTEKWADEAAPRVGVVLCKNEILNLPAIVQAHIDHPKTLDIEAYRGKILPNFGKSAKAIVDWAESVIV